MIVLEARKISQQYASRKNIAKIFDYKDPTKLLRGFRDLVDNNPSMFHPYKPYIKNNGLDTLYSIICFAYFFEFKDLLEAGTRSISFKKELPRLKEIYG